MAARRARRGEDQNLDSLLDTMANVTGILVMLLAVTQISMGDAVGRLRDLLAERPELTPEALERTESEAAELREALVPLVEAEAALLARRDTARAELAALDAGNTALESGLSAVRGSDTDTLRDRARGLLAREQALRGEVDAARAERTAVAEELARAVEQPLVRDVHLPDPRPAPPGARGLHVLVRHGRVRMIDERTLLDALHRGIEQALDAPLDRLQLSVLPLHQRIRLVAHFDRLPYGADGLRWRIVDRGRELIGVLEWRSTTLGETAEEIAQATSSFRRELRRTSPRRAFLRYMVWSDSFETYLAARAESDAEKFAAGFFPLDEEQEIVEPLTRNLRNPSFVD